MLFKCLRFWQVSLQMRSAGAKNRISAILQILKPFKITFLTTLLYGTHDKVSPSNIIKKPFLCVCDAYLLNYYLKWCRFLICWLLEWTEWPYYWLMRQAGCVFKSIVFTVVIFYFHRAVLIYFLCHKPSLCPWAVCFSTQFSLSLSCSISTPMQPQEEIN